MSDAPDRPASGPDDPNPSDGIAPRTADDRLLAELAAAGQEMPLPRPPEALTRSLQDLFQGEAEVQWYEAQLIQDSRTDLTLVGARGPSDQSVWTATYCAPNADLVLDGAFGPDGTITASGQIFPLVSGSNAFRVALDGPTSLSAYTDDLGQFEFGTLKPGSYTLRANNDRHGLTLTFEGHLPDAEADPA